MYNKELEELIESILADGVITNKEREVLRKRAVDSGVDPDEVMVIVEGRLAKSKNKATHGPVKYGNVNKCPNCGATVVAGLAVCRECGYAFSNVVTNSSISKLQDRLEKFHIVDCRDNIKKMEIITNFAVPNTKGDLLDFLSWLKPMANVNGPKNATDSLNQADLSYGYWILYSNCINKARVSFAGDKDFEQYFSFFDEQIKKSKTLVSRFKRLNVLVKLILIYAAACGALFVGCTINNIITGPSTEDIRSIRNQFDMAISKIESDTTNTQIDVDFEVADDAFMKILSELNFESDKECKELVMAYLEHYRTDQAERIMKAFKKEVGSTTWEESSTYAAAKNWYEIRNKDFDI